MTKYEWRESRKGWELYWVGDFLCLLEACVTLGVTIWACEVITDYSTSAADHREIARKLDELNGEDDR